MRTAWKIFLSDYKRLSASVVAVVVILGLCLVPCLYAWFNIFSNWDPYGPSATGNIRVAVTSEDAGAEMLGIRLNIGSMVLEGLQSNDQLGWVFVDSSEEAVAGVKSGEYYAALVMPDTFSNDFFSLLSGDLRHPQIRYYENQKKNAIAPKITGKAKTAVQEQINETLIGTVADTVGKVSSVMRALGLDADEVSARLTQRLESAGETMSSLHDTLESLRTTVREADSLLDCTDVVVDDMGQVLRSGQEGVRGTAAMLEDVPEVSSLLTDMDEVDRQLDGIHDELETVLSDLNSYRQFLSDGAGQMAERLDDMTARLQKLADSPAAALFPSVQKRLTDSAEKLQALSERLKQLSDTENLDALHTELTDAVQSVREQLRLGAAELGGGLDEGVRRLTEKAREALGTVDTVLGGGTDKLNSLSAALQQYDAALEKTQDTLGTAMTLADTAGTVLQDMADDVQRISSSPVFRELTDILENNPEELSEYLSEPVKLETVSEYAVSNYGSAMAPYYIMLALFVGSLLTATMVRVPIRTLPADVLTARPWQRFLGRYLLFFAIGMAQALVTALGCLYYVDIQCLHPGLFLLACCVCSLNFTLMNYALVYALDNMGMAISVVIMVIQVAGSGGTYPVDVLPAVFQKLYVCMPFRYGMDALRETIGGRYGGVYWENLAVLLGMCLLFVLLGLGLQRPARRLNEAIERSKEASGLM